MFTLLAILPAVLVLLATLTVCPILIAAHIRHAERPLEGAWEGDSWEEIEAALEAPRATKSPVVWYPTAPRVRIVRRAPIVVYPYIDVCPYEPGSKAIRGECRLE